MLGQGRGARLSEAMQMLQMVNPKEPGQIITTRKNGRFHWGSESRVWRVMM